MRARRLRRLVERLPRIPTRRLTCARARLQAVQPACAIQAARKGANDRDCPEHGPKRNVCACAAAARGACLWSLVVSERPARRVERALLCMWLGKARLGLTQWWIMGAGRRQLLDLLDLHPHSSSLRHHRLCGGLCDGNHVRQHPRRLVVFDSMRPLRLSFPPKARGLLPPFPHPHVAAMQRAHACGGRMLGRLFDAVSTRGRRHHLASAGANDVRDRGRDRLRHFHGPPVLFLRALVFRGGLHVKTPQGLDLYAAGHVVLSSINRPHPLYLI